MTTDLFTWSKFRLMGQIILKEMCRNGLWVFFTPMTWHSRWPSENQYDCLCTTFELSGSNIFWDSFGDCSYCGPDMTDDNFDVGDLEIPDSRLKISKVLSPLMKLSVTSRKLLDFVLSGKNAGNDIGCGVFWINARKPDNACKHQWTYVQCALLATHIQ